MKNFDPTKIDNDQVQVIKKLVAELRADATARFGLHLNELIREDILPLLDQYCTVVYFPSNDLENNGFHVLYPYKETTIHFVHINTTQYKEKQIFTAAHELGHFWDVDQKVEENCNKKFDTKYCERLISRFASDLLMPEEIFFGYANKEISNAKKDNALTVGGMVRAITAMMNEFFVPYKSVIYRLYELNMIDESAARLLWGENPELSRERLEDYSKKVALEQGFERLYKDEEAKGRKGIDGLKELLDKADDNGLLPVAWLKSFYERFDFQYEDVDKALENVLEISEGGNGIDAGECSN